MGWWIVAEFPGRIVTSLGSSRPRTEAVRDSMVALYGGFSCFMCCPFKKKGYHKKTSLILLLWFFFHVCAVHHWHTLIIRLMHKYIIRRYNWNYKIFKSAPACFGSQRIHHQGALYSAWLKLQKWLYRVRSTDTIEPPPQCPHMSFWTSWSSLLGMAEVSVTDFWGWDAHEARLRCPDDVSGDIGGCSARRALKPKFY